MPNEESVKRTQGGEPQLDGSPAKVLPPQESHVRAEVVPLQRFPGREHLSFLEVPVRELLEGLAIIPLCIDRGAAICGEVLEKTRKPLVRLDGLNRLFQGLSHATKLLAPGRKTKPKARQRSSVAGKKTVKSRFRTKPQFGTRNINLTAPTTRDEFTQE